MNFNALLVGVMLCVFCSCSGQPSSTTQSTEDLTTEIADSLPGIIQKPDLKKFYDEFNVTGMIVINDITDRKTILYNDSLLYQSVSPASTFNILLALIGLHEGFLKDEHSVLMRGDIKYTSRFGGDTCSLEEGFANNRDWFFIRLSSLIGKEKMTSWLHKLKYGNESIKGEENRFWINGELAITPEQQIEFIQKFYNEGLPFSKNEFRIVKKMMWQKELNGLKIYGKRGSNKLETEKRYTGWFVGYIESNSKVYFFTSFIESPDMDHPTIVDAQKEIPYKIFEYLQLK